MARVITKIGDVFCINLDDCNKKYFQYVAKDLTQLNSDVVRAFKKTYPIDENPNLPDVAKDEIAFYAHCVINLGVKMGVWQKVGKAPIEGEIDVLFRSTNDYGRKPDEAPVKISHNWYVWRINEESRRVGKLEGENQKSEIGMVMNPLSVVHRIRTGEYNLPNYPGY